MIAGMRRPALCEPLTLKWADGSDRHVMSGRVWLEVKLKDEPEPIYVRAALVWMDDEHWNVSCPHTGLLIAEDKKSGDFRRAVRAAEARFAERPKFLRDYVAEHGDPRYDRDRILREARGQAPRLARRKPRSGVVSVGDRRA